MEWHQIRYVILMLIAGQLVSICLTGMNIFVNQLASNGFDAPAFQSMFNYILLFLVHGTIAIVRFFKYDKQYNYKKDWKTWNGFLDVPFYYFAIVSSFDVGGNYCLVKAYQYTSITSATALDCFTIPCVFVLSMVFLGRKYFWLQILGVVLAIGGVALIIVSDVVAGNTPDDSMPPNPLLGDMFVLIGATLYALANVAEERLVKSKHVSEYLFMMGMFGSLFSMIIVLVSEQGAIASIPWTGPVIGYLIGFAGCGFLFYSTVGLFIQMYDALVFNLSVLTSDVYAVIFAYVVLHASYLHWLYFIGFTLVMGGVVLYSYYSQESVRRQEVQVDQDGVIDDLPSLKEIEEGSKYRL